MSGLFGWLGVLLACYLAYALFSGAVYAKSGVGGRTFTRADDALSYWAAIGTYGLLSLALVLVF